MTSESPANGRGRHHSSVTTVTAAVAPSWVPDGSWRLLTVWAAPPPLTASSWVCTTAARSARASPSVTPWAVSSDIIPTPAVDLVTPMTSPWCTCRRPPTWAASTPVPWLCPAATRNLRAAATVGSPDGAPPAGEDLCLTSCRKPTSMCTPSLSASSVGVAPSASTISAWVSRTGVAPAMATVAVRYPVTWADAGRWQVWRHGAFPAAAPATRPCTHAYLTSGAGSSRTPAFEKTSNIVWRKLRGILYVNKKETIKTGTWCVLLVLVKVDPY